VDVGGKFRKVKSAQLPCESRRKIGLGVNRYIDALERRADGNNEVNMKIRLRRIIWCISFMLAGFPFAHAGSDTPETGTVRTNELSESQESRQFVYLGNLVGATVRDAQGHKLGRIGDVLLNPQNAEVFATIGLGHALYTVVPCQAFTVKSGTGMLGKNEAVLNTTEGALRAGPTVGENDRQKLDDPNFTGRVYSYYNLQPPPEMGGTGAGSMGGSFSGYGASSTNKQVQPIAPRPTRP
jgi:hypothetical protein